MKDETARRLERKFSGELEGKFKAKKLSPSNLRGRIALLAKLTNLSSADSFDNYGFSKGGVITLHREDLSQVYRELKDVYFEIREMQTYKRKK